MTRDYRNVSSRAGLVLAGAALFGATMSGATKPGDATKGADTFATNCSSCHYTDSTEPLVGPGLKGLFKRTTPLVTKKKVTDENVLELIRKGSPVGMPAFEDVLSDQERADVLAYLKTL